MYTASMRISFHPNVSGAATELAHPPSQNLAWSLSAGRLKLPHPERGNPTKLQAKRTRPLNQILTKRSLSNAYDSAVIRFQSPILKNSE